MKKERLLLVAIIATMCIWGITWSSGKVLSAYGKPISIAIIRFSITSLTLAILLPILKIDIRINRKGYLYVIAAGGFMFLYGLCFFMGLENGRAGAGGVLVTTINPVFAYLIGLVVSKKMPTKREFLGLTIGLIAGTILLNLWSNVNNIFLLGNFYFVGAAFMWALMSKVSSNSTKFGTAMGFTLWLNVVATICFGFVADFNDVYQTIANSDGKFWVNIIYFGTINSAVATTCFIYATTIIGAEKSSSYSFIVPGAAMLSSWLFLGEPALPHTIIGGLIGILAVLVINGKIKMN